MPTNSRPPPPITTEIPISDVMGSHHTLAERARRRLPWLWALGALLLPLVLLWPMPLVFSTHVLSAPDQEAVQHLWGLWAAWDAGDLVRVHTDRIAWPMGFEFVLIDPGNIPWFALGSVLGPVAGYNTVLLVGTALAGVAGALLTRAAGGHGVQLGLGAVAAMSCPALLSAASEGITESFVVGWCGIALGALLLHLRDTRAGWRGQSWGALAALALAWSVWGGPYNGLWAALLCVPVALANRAAWRRWLPVGALGVLGGAPPVLASVLLRRDGLPGTGSRTHWELPYAEPEAFRGGFKLGADLTDPFLPGLLTGAEAPASHTAYLGVFVLLAACVGLWRHRRLWPFMVGAGAFVLLSLGPWLMVWGQPVALGGEHHMLTPVGWLAWAVPDVLRVTRWYRAAAVAGMLLAPLVALSVHRRGVVLALFIVLDACLLAPRAFPVLHFDGRASAVWSGLDRPGAVIDLPPVQWAFLPEGGVRDANLLQQTWHGRANAATFFNLSGGPASSHEVKSLEQLAEGRRFDARVAQHLANVGYAYVVLDQSRLPKADSGALSGALGLPVLIDPPYVVYELPEATEVETPNFPPFWSPRPPPGALPGQGQELQIGPGGHHQGGALPGERPPTRRGPPLPRP